MTAPTAPLPDITVYGRRGCPGCDATYRALRKLGVPFTGIDIDVINGAADRVRGLGYISLPVVVVESTGVHWAGFRPDRLRTLTAGNDKAA
jgi:glutaredoxin-like protein NrdH